VLPKNMHGAEEAEQQELAHARPQRAGKAKGNPIFCPAQERTLHGSSATAEARRRDVKIGEGKPGEGTFILDLGGGTKIRPRGIATKAGWSWAATYNERG